MNKIFVTGPTGTQGFPIVKELLAKGFQIRAFALESDPKLPQLKELGPNVEVVCGDLLDEESIYSARARLRRGVLPACDPHQRGPHQRDYAWEEHGQRL